MRKKSNSQLLSNSKSTSTNMNFKVEDDRTGMSKETLKRAFLDNLFYIQGIDRSNATKYDYYVALAYTVRDRLLHRFLKSVDTYQKNHGTKIVCYLSAEFLMGRHLGNNLINLDTSQEIEAVIKELDLDLDELIEQEPAPGLGNGGLGRLAACFLDSLAFLGPVFYRI